MEKVVKLGNIIKQKRLNINMTMDECAKKAGITRATLSSIENGTSNCSISTMFKVLDVLELSFAIDNVNNANRQRASRINTALNKKINKFIIMCVEEYAAYIDKSSRETYSEMKDKGVIDELKNDYEDLHGFSTVYLNEYIAALLNEKNQSISKNEHVLSKALVISGVTQQIAVKNKISIDDARDKVYTSSIIDLIDDDETGLYGASPLYILSVYENL